MIYELYANNKQENIFYFDYFSFFKLNFLNNFIIVFKFILATFFAFNMIFLMSKIQEKIQKVVLGSMTRVDDYQITFWAMTRCGHDPGHYQVDPK